MFFFQRPILIGGGAGIYKVMELNGSSILKCVDVKANDFTTWNTIVICRGETITQDQNYTKVTNFECLSRSGVGDFIVFSSVSEFETADHTGFSYNGTNVVVGLPKLIPINWTDSNLIGVYNTYPVLLNEEILRPINVYNITNNSINEYNISISVNSSSDSINYQLFIFPLLLASVVIGLLRLRKVL
ncbi:hypothetical protein [Metallosphaera hakonensis]|uniref:hypothetical protein n=1 Tax=Metallosphaera hakonensis TaxID=79601 RepID=UPI0011B24C2A|nr:hypothetical protein [Metallosphaera hakonensis]AWS00258.2 hypothetical protein DFR87_11875 [Metallosphaera hakonensis JCM 8857 = DSM 7519]